MTEAQRPNPDALLAEIQRGTLVEARRKLAALQAEIGDTDAALTRAQALIHRRETLGR